MQDRQGEGGGLAGSRLGDAAEVAAGEHEGDGLRLDRCRCDVSLVGKGIENGREKSKIGKTVQVMIP